MIIQVKYADIEKYSDIVTKDGLLLNKRCLYFGVFEDCKMVGFCGILMKKNRATLKCSYVAKYYRRKGYLNQMIKHRLDYLISIGISNVDSNCTEMSVNAHLGYGAKVVEEFKNGIKRVQYKL